MAPAGEMEVFTTGNRIKIEKEEVCDEIFDNIASVSTLKGLIRLGVPEQMKELL